MRQSNIFTKTRKEAPSDEVSKNAKLLIRSGYINKEMAGVYSYLPLGLRVLNNIKKIVSKEMEDLGSSELLMSTIQDKNVWQKTDRWDDTNVDVWFKSKLKNDTEIGFGWSHEEPITNMMNYHIASYKDLPITVHQFQNKLRNEVRAKSGIMRCREFIMKDMYHFSLSEEENNDFYNRAIISYQNIFKQVGLEDRTFVTSASGGVFTEKFSHEFQTICEAGEDDVFVNIKEKVAINEEVFNEDTLGKMGMSSDDFEKKKTAEVGNIFNFGSKKSEQMGLYITDVDGNKKPVFLSSFGIGITRLLGVLVESFSDESNLVVPESVAPFKYHLILVNSQNHIVNDTAEKIYRYLGVENVLYDDRDVRLGEKLAESDLIGIPNRIIVGEKNILNNKVEFIDRVSGETRLEDIHDILKMKI